MAAGQTWTDPYSNLSISVQSATAGGLTVAVNYGAVACNHANPTVALSPATQSASAGSTVNYTVSVTNNDGPGCSASTFSLASTQPAGWSGSFSTGPLTLTPGQTTSVTLAESIPASGLPGTYTVGSSSSSPYGTGSGAANCTVTTAPILTDAISVAGSAFLAHQTVPVTAKVLYGSSPAAGAVVTFTLTRSNGSTVAGTATADATGVAAWSYKLTAKDPSGTYSVSSKVSYNNQTVSSTAATFTVQ